MKAIYFPVLFLLLFVCACNNHQFQSGKPIRKSEIDTLKKKIVQGEKLSNVNYNQVFEDKIVDGNPIKLLKIGELKVPSGKIVACDPLITSHFTPFNKKVKPGIYPIKIYVAQTKGSGERYAIVKLEFNFKKADKWVLALHSGENTSALKNTDDYFGFPVDAGLGSLIDYKAALDYEKFKDDFEKQHRGSNIYDDYLATEFKKNAKGLKDEGDWVNFQIPNSDLNIAMFQSGYGDGRYPTYWGMTKDNEIVSLIIDFLVLPLNRK